MRIKLFAPTGALVVLSILLMSCLFLLGSAESAPSSLLANRVDVYYFHGNFRCVSCRKIEDYTKTTLETFFKPQLASGKLVYKVINVEKKGNERFVRDYQLYTKSVALSLVENGREVKYKNLGKVWEYLGDKERFSKYIKEEVMNFLNLEKEKVS